MADSSALSRPVVAACANERAEMAAARALADHLGTDVLTIGTESWSDPAEVGLWHQARELDERARNGGRFPWARTIGALLGLPGPLAPLQPGIDLSAPDRASRRLDSLVAAGLARGFAGRLRRGGPPLVTTHAPLAVAVERTSTARVFCVVTDNDLPRHWAPLMASKSNLQYLVPSRRAFDRLCAYGVMRGNVHYTGIPLHPRLLGDAELPVTKANLAARLLRLDPGRAFLDLHEDAIARRLGPLPGPAAVMPPLVTVVVDGAGARRRQALRTARELLPQVDSGRLRLAILSDCRSSTAEAVELELHRPDSGALARLGVRVATLDYTGDGRGGMFDLLGESDVLWTRPSELVFLAALGLPLLITACDGPYETATRRWAVHRGAAKTWTGDLGGEQIARWLADGTLAESAWAGFRKLPKRGLFRIEELVNGQGE